MIDISNILEHVGSGMPPADENNEKPNTATEPESTCFCCGKPFVEGRKVIANESTADFGNAKVVVTLVCCSKRCANRVDKLLSILVGMAAQSLHVGLHTNGSVDEFGMRMHALALIVRACAPTEPETTNNAI